MNVIEVDFRKRPATPTPAVPPVDQQLGDISDTVAALSKNLADLRAMATEEEAVLGNTVRAEASLSDAVQDFAQAVETMGGLMDRYLHDMRALNR